MNHKELEQVWKVAEAARQYREHQYNIEFGRRGGDIHRQNYDNQTEALLIELDRALSRWRKFGEASDNNSTSDGSRVQRLFLHRRPRPKGPSQANGVLERTADDESKQILRVATAAQALCNHQFSLHSLIESGDYNGEEFYEGKQKLLALLDVELEAWKQFD